jgi:thiamine biosynthesis protein ThiS
MISVTINGDQREVPEGSIAALLEQLGLHPQLIVVEHNREIVDRNAFEATELKSGDTVELVHFVGGG